MQVTVHKWREYNYAVVMRLQLIDTLLRIYGKVGRTVLIDYFGIGAATATRDLKEYKSLAPRNMQYNESDKTYYRVESFVSLFGRADDE